MKKIFSIMLGLAAMTSLFSCKDSEYTDRYANPAQTQNATCEKLMTGAFYAGKDYTFNSYWRMYTWDNGILGKYAQTIGAANAPGSYYIANDSYANNRWEGFYKVLIQFRALENIYNSENAENQQKDLIFKDLTEIFLYDHLSQIIDVFGDVPFSKAGYLGITGDVAGSYAAYDSATELYKTMLKRLGELNTEISQLKDKLPSTTAASLPLQDLINGGDLEKWQMYCNGLRLRLAVRVAEKGLPEEGKAAIKDILNGNLVAPLSTDFASSIKVQGDGGSTDELNYKDGIRDGYKDHSHASQVMLDVLLNNNDPRLPVLYSKNAAGEYKGLSVKETYKDQQDNMNKTEKERVYSRIDSTTVIYNQWMYHPIITAAEVWFLKAECYQKGWASGDAEDAFKNGVAEAILWAFENNKVSESTAGYKAKTIPTKDECLEFAGRVWRGADDKYAAIITQKWFNFGFWQAEQAWNEIRRTGIPAFEYFNDETAQLLKTLPNRVRYPGAERDYNTTNYKAALSWMGGTDDAYAKIFWAK